MRPTRDEKVDLCTFREKTQSSLYPYSDILIKVKFLSGFNIRRQMFKNLRYANSTILMKTEKENCLNCST